MVRDLIIFAGGALVGFAIAHWVYSKKLKKEIRAMNEEMIAVSKRGKELEEEENMSDEEKTKRMEELLSRLDDQEEKGEPTMEKREYEPLKSFMIDEETEVTPIPPIDNPRMPFIIDYQDFEEGYPRFEPMYFTYYAGDGVVIDDTSDDTVENFSLFVGDCIFDWDHTLCEDKDMMIVRNEKMMIDIEITRVNERYYDDYDDYDDQDDD